MFATVHHRCFVSARPRLPRVLRLISAALGTIAATSTLAAQPRTTSPAISPVLAAQLERAVDSLVRRALALQLTPGMSVAVVTSGRVLFAHGHGIADAGEHRAVDARTLWYVASTSKSYTGVATLLLATRDAMSLETPISTWLPGVTWPDGVHPDSLTLADFLGHTHGLGNGPLVVQAAFVGAIPEAAWPQLLATTPRLASRALRYNNLGYNVAAMVIDRRHARGWRDWIDASLLRPAGLRDTHARVSGLDQRRFARPHTQRADGAWDTVTFPKSDATMNSAGGHLATLGDLARWTLLNLDEGRLDGRQVVPAHIVRDAQRPLRWHAADDPGRRYAYFDRAAWGAGWNLGAYEGARMVSRFGSYLSFRSHLSFLPDHGVGVVALSNGEPGGPVTDMVAALVYDWVLGRPDAVAQAHDRLTAHARSALVSRTRSLRDTGTFHHPALGTLVLHDVRGVLQLGWGVLRGPTIPLSDQPDARRFDMAGNELTLRLGRDSSGTVHTVTVLGLTASRVHTPQPAPDTPS